MVLLCVDKEPPSPFLFPSYSHFEQYLGSGLPLDFATFRRHVDSITQRFQRLSAEVLAQQPRFEEAERDDLLVALGTLQRLESAKLAKVGVLNMRVTKARWAAKSVCCAQWVFLSFNTTIFFD